MAHRQRWHVSCSIDKYQYSKIITYQYSLEVYMNKKLAVLLSSIVASGNVLVAAALPRR